MAKYIENRPTADILMNSMRSMGYSFESAIADVIDNSISVHARHIDIKFPVDPQDCYIAICDDGAGMDKKELFEAMKYGSGLKGEIREENDLGRFGIGLKSASLSQCRKLTVASKKNGKISAFIWDLDVINSRKEWSIIECSENEIQDILFIEYLGDKVSGTVVIWENFDIIEKSTSGVYNTLSKYKESTANYLSLIFHRFLNKPGDEKIDISINNYHLECLDPFLEKHKKTNPRREITLAINDSKGIERYVKVQPFVLPFQKDMSKEDMKKIGGVENYRTKQGFYIYRSERLIIWGTWFGRAKGELTKHARVKVDIPNTLDDIWDIDIKKQNARIPAIIKNQLTKAVDEAMNIAIKSQTYRGRIEKIDEHIDYIWDRIKDRDDNYTYRINRNSQIFDLIRYSVDDSTWSKIDMVLDEVENSIPYQQIYIDKSQNKVSDYIDKERMADIEAKAEMIIKTALNIGELDRQTIIDKLFMSEPFNKYSELKQKLEQEEL